MDDVKLLNLTGITWEKLKDLKDDEKVCRPKSAEENIAKSFYNPLSFINDDNIGAVDGNVDLKPIVAFSLPQIIDRKLPKNLFEKKKPGVPRQKVKPPTAWPERSIPEYPQESNVKAKRVATQVSNEPRANSGGHIMASRLSRLQKSSTSSQREESLARMQLLQNADEMVGGLPLVYLYSKVELRKYAIQRIYGCLARPAGIRVLTLLRHAFQIWKCPPKIPFESLSEKQIGFLVIAKCLSELLKTALRQKFRLWALGFSSRFSAIRAIRPNEAAAEIQRWYRQIRITRREPFRQLAHAIQVCLHRRRAIKHIVRFELARRHALDKVKRGVALRRRLFFAARSIQRVYRWISLVRKTRWRLTRLFAIRKIQIWRRKTLKRNPHQLLVLRLLMRCGGYSLVVSKIPKKLKRYNLIEAADLTVTRLQKAWYQSQGQMALYMAFAARKAKLAYEQMQNDKATIIQNSYRAHLWDLLLLAAHTNNRARRIQRGFRAQQYRVWGEFVRQRGRNRRAVLIQRCMRRVLWRMWLRYRFKARKALIVFLNEKRLKAAIYIQRAFRKFLVRLLAFREEMKKFYAQQRAQVAAMVNYISCVQRNWRQIQEINAFPFHVKLLCHRLVRERRRALNKNAYIIQKLALQYIQSKRAERLAMYTRTANVIWHNVKALLLRQALMDRVLATRERKRVASNRMKKNFRWALWWRQMQIRFAIMRARFERRRICEAAAVILQRFRRRKVLEYNMALRIAGRRQLHKKRMREEADRWWKRRHHAASVVQKLFRGNRLWMRTLRRVAIERQRLRESRARKKIYRFGLMMLAWQRFWHAVDEKNARKEAERIRRIEQRAVNIIGYYWRRKHEKGSLATRFNLRRKMIDTYNELKAEREEAERKRDDALEEVRRTEENMDTTIAASWKQGSDTEGRNYYYNFVTGESSWLPPKNWKMKVLDQWIRNIDARQNVYYYNQQTAESRWLPPCCICGLESMKFCSDCGVAYCEPDFDRNHGPDADESMTNHAWSLTEYEKDKLMPGEIFCIECKRRAAKVMCTSCWDSYCDECFKFIHHIGALRTHKSIPYKKAKKGWMCVRARIQGETDYYVHGTTGETKYEKPEELMTDQERIYFSNFRQHQLAAEEQVKQIEKLQFDLEAVSYERDMILFEALQGGGNVGKVLRKKEGAGGAGGAGEDVLKASMKKGGGGGLFSMFTGLSADYKQKLMRPNERPRGQTQSDYLKELIEKASKDNG